MSGWLTFHVKVSTNTYPVSLQLSSDVPLPAVKKLILAKLKDPVAGPRALSHVDIRVEDLTLKTEDGHVIVEDEMPKGNKFKAELLVPILPKPKQYHTDGLDIADGKYLGREALLKKVMEKLQDSQFVVISSPPASGKTSLFELLNCKYKLRAHYVRCVKTEKSNLELIHQLFETFDNLQAQGRAPDPFYVFLDDAQKIYDDSEFWEQLIIASKISTAKNFKFVISATHLLSIRSESPADLQLFPRIIRDDLLISDEDASALIDMCDFCGFSLKLYPFSKYAIVKEAAGLIGAVIISVYKISDKFRHSSPEESDVLQYFLSAEFSSEIGRLFGTDIMPIDDEFHLFLRNCFLNSGSSVLLDGESRVVVNSLVKGGALVQTGDDYRFSSPLAKRFYFKSIFPHRVAMQVPSDIFTLVKYGIAQMSASNLLKSTVNVDDFPKEAVFRHEFMSGLAAVLPPKCYICPELSGVFPDDQTLDGKIDGELDLYINGNLRWGIELLVMGDKITEHMNRFSVPHGKYAPLHVTNYAVVDFRRSSNGKPTNVMALEKRVSVVFPLGDFSSCVCRFGNDPLNHIIKLSS